MLTVVQAQSRLECTACGSECSLTSRGEEDVIAVFTIHRDGLGQGPEVPLCDRCGAGDTPTCEQLWEMIRLRALGQIPVSL